MISVCLRFDDPSPTSDHRLEKDLIEIIARHGLSACFAVVPYRLSQTGEAVGWTPAMAAHLIEAEAAGIIDIAQHGYTHKAISRTAAGDPSEYCGVDALAQAERIAKGLEHLHAIFGDTIKGFVPPWNSYDRHTVDAVDSQGLGFLSGGREIVGNGSLPVIPRTCTLKSVEKELRLALRYPQLDPVVSIVFHPDEFREFSLPLAEDDPPPYTSLAEFDRLLGRIKANPAFCFDTLHNLAASLRRQPAPLWYPGDLSWVKALPWRMKGRLPLSLLIRAPKWRALWPMLRDLVRVTDPRFAPDI